MQSNSFALANLKDALILAFLRLKFGYQAKNPVIFVVFVSAILSTIIFIHDWFGGAKDPLWFTGAIAFWLWFTVIFANFAESIAESKGKAQAEFLKKSRRDVLAKKLVSKDDRQNYNLVSSSDLKINDIILIEAGDFIPSDGQIIEGVASVDESAITGESAPVIRENGGDHDSVTGGTKVLSNWIVVKITTSVGDSFLTKMIALVEGAKRQKTPNEIALSILLSAMTIIFLLTCATLLPFALFTIERNTSGAAPTIVILVALLVCLAPTTIGGLLSAIGIAGMNRLIKANVITSSGRSVEAAGDISVLLLDKTGTITHGNRQAVEFIPDQGVTIEELAQAAFLSSLSDQTPEGKSISALAVSQYQVSEANHDNYNHDHFIPFSAETRMSGIKLEERHILKGSSDAIDKHVTKLGGNLSSYIAKQVEIIARKGGTPLLVADDHRVLGVVYLKDIVKAGIKERLAELRKMGIKSVMVTGDNPLTAAAIAAEVGVDDFIAQATPEAKLKYIRKMQEGGDLVAMVGDGTNDAPALAQADVAVAMNSGTQAAKEASNMVDLDSNPTKLIEIVEIGKQLLMTRGSLTTFSIANDLAKYFAIIPAVFVGIYPSLAVLNIMHLTTPISAILSAVIFNALIIIFLIPLALKGVKYRPASASTLLARNILIYGLGGVVVPFVGIKIIDLLLKSLSLV